MSMSPPNLSLTAPWKLTPEVRRYVGGAPRTREDAERKFRNVHLKPASDRLVRRATIFKPEGRYFGYCGLYPFFSPRGPAAGEATLGFCLSRDYWGRGLASEAARIFIRFGFSQCILDASLPLWRSVTRCPFAS